MTNISTYTATRVLSAAHRAVLVVYIPVGSEFKKECLRGTVNKKVCVCVCVCYMYSEIHMHKYSTFMCVVHYKPKKETERKNKRHTP